MEFSKQIKKIRTEKQLTQEQLAQQLNVSRQTISSWENNRNLPDLEMVVSIAKLFGISLDHLILGDEVMTKKLVQDANEVKKARMNLMSIALIVTGILLFLAKSMIGVTVTKDGILQEPFFLLPLGYLCLAGGLILIGASFIKKLKK